MSTLGETPAELISDFQQTYTYTLTFLSALAMLGWEYVITFDREASLVWGRKLNGASLLFFLNRYLMVIQFAVQLPISFSISDEHTDGPSSCTVLNRFIAVFSVAPYFVWAAFSALRAYAMSNRSWPIASLIYILSIIPCGYNIYNFAREVPINLPAPIYCIATFPTLTSSYIDHWTTATRICLIIADALVIAVTWWSTYRFRKLAAEANVKTSLLKLVLRDGTTYFLILLVLNILHIILRTSTNATVNYITTFEEPLTSILISRFIMNLREVDYTAGTSPGDGMSDSDFSRSLNFAERSHFTQASQGGTGTLRFVASFVDPLGTQLDHESDIEPDAMVGSFGFGNESDLVDFTTDEVKVHENGQELNQQADLDGVEEVVLAEL